MSLQTCSRLLLIHDYYRLDSLLTVSLKPSYLKTVPFFMNSFSSYPLAALSHFPTSISSARICSTIPVLLFLKRTP